MLMYYYFKLLPVQGIFVFSIVHASAQGIQLTTHLPVDDPPPLCRLLRAFKPCAYVASLSSVVPLSLLTRFETLVAFIVAILVFVF